MATVIKRQVGTMACMCCGHEIPVKQAENGTLNAACSWCDFPAYAKAGTQAHRIISGRLKNRPDLDAAPEQRAQPTAKPAPPAKPKAEPAPEPARAQRARNSIFDLGAA